MVHFLLYSGYLCISEASEAYCGRPRTVLAVLECLSALWFVASFSRVTLLCGSWGTFPVLLSASVKFVSSATLTLILSGLSVSFSLQFPRGAEGEGPEGKFRERVYAYHATYLTLTMNSDWFLHYGTGSAL